MYIITPYVMKITAVVFVSKSKNSQESVRSFLYSKTYCDAK